MDIRKLQRAIVDGLEDVKGQNIVVFNTEHLSPLFERVVIASGTSNRQTKALAASVRDAVKSSGFPILRTEGEGNGEWIIVDCGAAVVHLMQPSIRDYYHLEEIWGDKPVRLKLDASPLRLVKAAADAEPAAPARKTAARKRAAPAAPAAAGPATAPARRAARPTRDDDATPAKAAARPTTGAAAPRKRTAPRGAAAAAGVTRTVGVKSTAAKRAAAAEAPAATGAAPVRRAAAKKAAPAAAAATRKPVVKKVAVKKTADGA